MTTKKSKLFRRSFQYWMIAVLAVVSVIYIVADWRLGKAQTTVVGICASGKLEIYAKNTEQGWAKVRCTAAPSNILSDSNGFALNWRDAIKIRADGLTYATFLITEKEMGGYLRWNDASSYQALVVGHSGGGGIQFPLTRDAGLNDSTDWQDLQDTYGMRVVEIAWLDTGITARITGGGSAGRFTRSSVSGSTLGLMAEQLQLLYEWIFDNLNASQKPMGLLGSSGGADAVLSPEVLQSRIKDNIQYIAPVSYPSPFFDLLNTCNGITPPGTYVTPATGALSNSGAGIRKGSGGTLMDYILNTPNNNCVNGTMTAAMAAGSSDKDALQTILNAGGTGYKGTLHVLVGTNPQLDSDIKNGAVWSAGNLINHLFFAGANRIWFESITESHGDPFTKSGPGFTQIYNELIKTLIP